MAYTSDKPSIVGVWAQIPNHQQNEGAVALKRVSGTAMQRERAKLHYQAQPRKQ